MRSSYPEHDKLHAVRAESQAQGEFLEWLQRKGLVLCERTKSESQPYWPTGRTILGLLTEYHNINQSRLEEEKMAILEAQRVANRSRRV